VVITRPVGTARAMAQRLRALGATAVVLPSVRLAPAPLAAARAALGRARRADIVVFLSPAAVRFAFRLAPGWRPSRRGVCLAVGPGTCRALRRHGVAAGIPAARHDSEGLLALPALQKARGRKIVLVGAPGGRDLLAATLGARGAKVELAEVYRRLPARWNRRHHAALRLAPRRLCWLVSSVEAIAAVRSLSDAATWTRLRGAHAVAASERVAAALAAAGVARATVAGSAMPRALIDAAVALTRRTHRIR
jgi:uroporphyrinogen-III synthase